MAHRFGHADAARRWAIGAAVLTTFLAAVDAMFPDTVLLGVFVLGVFAGMVDKFPLGALMNKGLTLRTGQTHVNRWTDDLLRRIEDGQIDPSFVVTHTARLEDGPEMYKVFRDKQDNCVKVVLKP
mgnify:CR=1 FL=1